MILELLGVLQFLWACISFIALVAFLMRLTITLWEYMIRMFVKNRLVIVYLCRREEFEMWLEREYPDEHAEFSKDRRWPWRVTFDRWMARYRALRPESPTK